MLLNIYAIMHENKFAFVCIPAAENNNHPLQEQIASLLTIYFPLMLLRVKWVHGLCIIYYFLSRAYSSSSILKHTQAYSIVIRCCTLFGISGRSAGGLGLGQGENTSGSCLLPILPPQTKISQAVNLTQGEFMASRSLHNRHLRLCQK